MQQQILSFPQAERVGNPSSAIGKDSGQAGMTKNKVIVLLMQMFIITLIAILAFNVYADDPRVVSTVP